MTREIEAEHDGKYSYETRHAAELYLKFKRRHKTAPHRRLTIYRCIFCQQWHVGTKAKPTKKAR